MAGSANSSMIVTVIFGRSSFIGRALVAALLRDGRFTVHVVDPLPAPDPTPSLSPFFQSGRISYHHVDIGHRSPTLLAAFTDAGTVFHIDPTVAALQLPSTSDFQGLHHLLVQSTRNVLRTCWECGVQRLVYIGSADAVIGRASEVSNWNESVAYPEKFDDSLGELRVQVEAMVLRANTKDRLLTCALRVSNPFGPGDDSLVPFLVQRAKEGWAKFIIGNGKISWDFTYVENVAHASMCAEQALRSRTPYVAGRPFFITNQKPMNLWEFQSSILEGLGYQRPNVHIPVIVVLVLAEIGRFFQEKFSWKFFNCVVTLSTLRSFRSTRTFDCSNAERVLGYTPVVSLEDGLMLTISSFSQLANGSHNMDQQDLTKPSKAEKLIGNQSGVADILLWRDDRRTFTCLLALFMLHYWFFLSERTFISSVAKLLMLFALILFIHGALPSSMLGFPIEKIPSSSFEVSESTLRNFLSTVASLWNQSICILGTVAQGENSLVLLKVASFLYLFKLLLLFSLPTVSAAGLVCLFSFFIVYEQCESEIDALIAAAACGLDKMKGFLLAKLPSFVAKYVP